MQPLAVKAKISYEHLFDKLWENLVEFLAFWIIYYSKWKINQILHDSSFYIHQHLIVLVNGRNLFEKFSFPISIFFLLLISFFHNKKEVFSAALIARKESMIDEREISFLINQTGNKRKTEIKVEHKCRKMIDYHPCSTWYTHIA